MKAMKISLFLVAVLFLFCVTAVFSDSVEQDRIEQTRIDVSQVETANRENGTPCRDSRQCESSCCKKVLNFRTCAPLKKPGESCTNAQVKLNVYDRDCPCQEGSRCVYDYQCS